MHLCSFIYICFIILFLSLSICLQATHSFISPMGTLAMKSSALNYDNDI